MEKTIAYLNNTYPNGLTEINLVGKVVAVGAETGAKNIYAFDYSQNNEGSYNGWFYVGNFSSSSSSYVVGKETDIVAQEEAKNLSVGGLWFVLED